MNTTRNVGPLATLIVVAVIVSLTLLAYTNHVNGDAVVALLSAIVGGVLVREVQRTNGAS